MILVSTGVVLISFVDPKGVDNKDFKVGLVPQRWVTSQTDVLLINWLWAYLWGIMGD